MTGEMSVSYRDDIVIAKVGGEVDLSNARAVAESILERVSNEAVGLVLDATELRYLDSVGISALFSIVRRLESRGKRFALALPSSSPLQRLLAITEAQQAFAIAADVNEAVERMRAAAHDPLA